MAKPWWEDGVNKADPTAFRSDLGISCVRLVYLATDLGKSDPIPRLLVPLHLLFNPAPFCLQTEAHEAPRWTAPQRHSPLWSCLAHGHCQAASSPSPLPCIRVCPAVACSSHTYPVSTFLPRKRKSRSKYPATGVSGQQDSSSVGVPSGSSLHWFCTPLANSRWSKQWRRFFFPCILWPSDFRLKSSSLKLPDVLWRRSDNQAAHLCVWLYALLYQAAGSYSLLMESTTFTLPSASYGYCTTLIFSLFVFWHLTDLVPVLGEYTKYLISFLFSF